MKALFLILFLSFGNPLVEKHNAKLDSQIVELSFQIDSLIQLKDSLKNEKLIRVKDLSAWGKFRIEEARIKEIIKNQ